MTETLTINLKSIFLRALAVYVLLIVAFYFLAGDQLRFRESRGDVSMLPAETGTVELVEGAVVEQTIKLSIQRLEEISVQFGSYNHIKSGTVTMELLRDGVVQLQGSFDAGTIQDGTILTMTSPQPLENLCEVPALLRIYSDAKPGQGPTVMMNTSAVPSAATGDHIQDSLILNGTAAAGTICFSARGTDYIWTGLHYWKFAIGLGIVLILLFLVFNYRYTSGKRSYLVSAMLAMKKYRFLIRQLVARDFKKKYKRSVLGMFWSFLNPLLTMLVQYVVFSTIFKSDIPHFAAYLISGMVMFNFFTEASGMTLMSILDNSGLITKVYMPKYIYPLTRTMSSLVNFAISLIPMLMVCLLTGVRFHKSAVLAFFFYVCLFIFSLGFGMLLCTSMVFFRDTQFLWNVLSLMWMYMTPLFYPETILPENLRGVLQLNPMYHFVRNARICILDGISPEPIVYFKCLGIALAALLIGTLVFYRNQDKFVLYL